MIARSTQALIVACALVSALGCGGASSPAATSPRHFDLEILAEGAGGKRALERLAVDFYGRLEDRRFDSIATYQDPALREFFRTVQSWSDYYADLVQDLSDRYFLANRPTEIEIESIEFADAGPEAGSLARASIRLRFTGGNRLPLRFWNAHLSRVDQWELEGSRWWIKPGKL